MIKEMHQLIVTEPNNLKIYSGVMPNKQMDGAIFVYDMLSNDKNLENSTQEEIEKKLKNTFNYDYNGVLAWVPKQYQDNFIRFVETYIVEKYNRHELDFSNGSLCEAIGFHYLNEGILVELVYASNDKDTFIDGIYNRGIFNDLFNEFYEQENIWEDAKDSLDLTQAFTYHTTMVVSSLKIRNNDSAEKAKFYDLIQSIK